MVRKQIRYLTEKRRNFQRTLMHTRGLALRTSWCRIRKFIHCCVLAYTVSNHICDHHKKFVVIIIRSAAATTAAELSGILRTLVARKPYLE